MESLNFEFLRPKYAALAHIGALAEAGVHSDPPSGAVKLWVAYQAFHGGI